MSIWDVLFIALAGFWAGGINVVVGSGTLVSFPVLVAVGIPPVTATMSNAMGLVAGNFSGVIAYRRELRQIGRRLLPMALCSVVGGIIGSSLLLHLPARVFSQVAPWLVLLAICLVAFQPMILKQLARRRSAALGAQPASSSASAAPQIPAPTIPAPTIPAPSIPALIGVFLVGIYGGYFVAAGGIFLMGVLGILWVAGLQYENAVKNFLVMTYNLVAALSYLLLAPERINWWAVLIIAVSSFLGGLFSGRFARKIPPTVLRGIIIAMGCVALVNLLLKQ